MEPLHQQAQRKSGCYKSYTYVCGNTSTSCQCFSVFSWYNNMLTHTFAHGLRPQPSKRWRHLEPKYTHVCGNSITSCQCSCVFFFCNAQTDTHFQSWPTAAAIASRNAFEPPYRIMRDLHLEPITKDDMQMIGVLTSLSLRQNRAKWP